MPEQQQDRQRFSELLPFHVNGTLSPKDQAWMDTYLEKNPEAQQERHFIERLRDSSLQTKPPSSPNQQLERFLQELRKGQPTKPWWERFATLLMTPLPIPSAVVAFVGVIVIGQSLWLGLVDNELPVQETFRGERQDCLPRNRLRVVFNPEAKHMEVLLLLRKIEATFNNGPSENGELWLTVPPGRSVDEALTVLRSSPLVDEALQSPTNSSPSPCAR